MRNQSEELRFKTECNALRHRILELEEELRNRTAPVEPPGEVRERDHRIGERLMSAVDRISDALFLLDNDQRLLWANHSTARFSQTPLEDMQGRPCTEVLFCRHTGCEDCPAPNSLALDEEGERIIRTSDGSYWEMRTFPVHPEQGQVTGVIGMLRNITGKRVLEEELEKRQRLQSLGVLAGGIAHDFNNILTAIIGNTSLAKMLVHPDDKVFPRLCDVEKAAIKAKDLAGQLLTFSKGGSPRKKVVALDKLLQEATHFALHGSNIKPEFTIDTELWPSEVDTGQFAQVINNITINAQQSMPDGGVIHVQAANFRVGADDMLPLRSGDYVQITIEDEGQGIPHDHLTKIFDPFFSTKRLGKGLGLATAYSIVKKHGGFIMAASPPKRGSVFTIYLPAARVPEEDGLIPESAQPRHPGSGKGSILFMDDEKFIRNIAGGLLEHLGYKVTFARDGQESISLYSEALSCGKRFDAVILDITIPGGMGGKECLQELQKIDPQVRAIISSGYSNDPLMSEPEKYGFKAVVAKPYRIQELNSALNKAMKMP